MKPLCYDYLNCPTTFSTYDDFNKKFRITRPESFNFAYDVADRIAQEEPDRLAVLWTDETGACIRYTFGQLKEESDRAANLFKSLGIWNSGLFSWLCTSWAPWACPPPIF